ncbi:helix-turn-helix domain-containing protein [Paenibacillus sp. MMO-177]|uniref:helix-turn-helix domain-containing protein n=1 Tax=Paenibacillus sp. MMO-177 TaxID=3081289 RepID=UPI00301AC6D7
MARSEDIFAKLHRSAYDKGLMGQLSSGAWKALCALSVHMKEDGTCWPAQATLAEKLDQSEKAVSRWIGELLAFRWNGKPIVTVVKNPVKDKPGHFYNVYTIHKESGFSIFSDQRNGSCQNERDQEARYNESLNGGHSMEAIMKALGSGTDLGV